MRLRYVLGLLVLVLMLAGCGGSSSNATLPSLYAGSWAGTWTGPLAEDGGTMAWKVDSTGNLSGTMTRTGPLSGTVGGVVDKTGHYKATTTFPSSGNFVIDGAAVVGSGGLQGTFSYTWLGGTYQGSFTMTAATSA